MHYDAFKCTLKELTTNSVFNARCLRSFGMRMPSCLLLPSLDWDQVDRFFFVLCCPCHEFPFSPFLPPPPHHHPLSLWFFYHWYFSVWCLPVCFPLLWGPLAGLRCYASHGALFILSHLAAKSESPWILQAPILHLAMQLLTKSFSKLEVKCIKWNPIISGQPFHWDLYKLI